MASALISHIGAFVDTVERTHWDGKSIIIPVCPICGYWPINGEEALPQCKRCKLCVDLPGASELHNLYRQASGMQWLTKARITPTETHIVKV